jgi:hydrogenase expression/formation protein HypE
MKDPTRGGTSVALNEIASKSEIELELDESLIPIRPAVQSLCGILGLNPLNMSNEGTIVMASDPSKTEEILTTLQGHKSTKNAQLIGKAKKGKSRVLLKTKVGGKRIVQVPYGEPIPRVC